MAESTISRPCGRSARTRANGDVDCRHAPAARHARSCASPPPAMARPISNGQADGRVHRVGMLGLYLHIPFCAAICNYCNFNRGLFDEALKTRYVEAMLLEIAGPGGA